MLDQDTVIRTPHDAVSTHKGGKKRTAVRDPRVSVSMKAHGCELVLFFDDSSGEGPVRELRLLPDEQELEPHVLRRFFPQAPLYARYARAAIQYNEDDVRAALMGLREVGTTRRGLGDEFYRIVAANYQALIDEGEQYPVKALAEIHHVVISTASRWITEAKRRGYVAAADPNKVTA